MTQYIKFVADRLVVQLGYKKIYNVSNPFPWMELISLEGKTNFFEKRVADYALANKSNTDTAFEINEDF
jgi:ribonucleotide reductase beta subunit family protein with ferritin-like domain